MYQYTTRNYISFAGDRPLLNKYAKKSMKLSTVDMLSTFVQCRIYPLCQWSGKVKFKGKVVPVLFISTTP
jgi:hypothetical protein